MNIKIQLKENPHDHPNATLEMVSNDMALLFQYAIKGVQGEMLEERNLVLKESLLKTYYNIIKAEDWLNDKCNEETHPEQSEEFEF